MTTVSGLACRECGHAYDKVAVHVCEHCFGPLEVVYDYAAVAKSFTREALAARPTSMWRYHELLPLDGPPTVGAQVGWTPLVRADRLARVLGVREVWVKNDAVSFPTLSFKDRVVSVALSKARELGFDTVACASTGNLANSVAANAAAGGLRAYIFIPHDLEPSKVVATQIYGARVIAIRGTYDDVNRLCSELAGKYNWGSPTSTCGRSMPRARRATSTRSSSSSAGASPTTSSRRWRAARSSPRSARRCSSSTSSASSRVAPR
jgi:threonine synthase